MAMKNSTGVGTYLFTPEFTFEMLVCLVSPKIQLLDCLQRPIT